MEELTIASSSSAVPAVVPLSFNGSNFPKVEKRKNSEEVSDVLEHIYTPQKRTRASSGGDESRKTPSSDIQRMYRGLESLGKQLEEINNRSSTADSQLVSPLDEFAAKRPPQLLDEHLTHVKPHHISPIEINKTNAVNDSYPSKASGIPVSAAQKFHPDSNPSHGVEAVSSTRESQSYPVRRENNNNAHMALSSRRSTTPPPNLNAYVTSQATQLPNLNGVRAVHRSPSPQKARTQSKTPSAKAAGSGAPSSPTTRTRDGRIKVVVRKRPLMDGEAGTDCVAVASPQITLEITKQRVDLSEYTQRSDFCFDEVFNEGHNNQDVYRSCALELLDVALLGGSASCFAYGQTGSGKTHTMMGNASEKGLYLLAASDLFDRVNASHRLDVSFYEIYCNSLFDLLNGRSQVVLREGSDRRVNVCGLSWHSITSAGELWGIISAGMEQRKTGSTSANEQSSRSHAILSIRITNTAQADFQGIINFVDLAGSERAADTANNEKQTRLEGAEINKSLLALKECIRALDERKKHVPFRGSRLTEVLRDSFTGNSKTVMIANISPSSVNFEHTANTLRYSFRVKGLSVATVTPDKARNAPRPYVAPIPSRTKTRPQDLPQSTPTKQSSRQNPSDFSSAKRGGPLASPLNVNMSERGSSGGEGKNARDAGAGIGSKTSLGAASSEDVYNTPDARHRPQRAIPVHLSPGNSLGSMSYSDTLGNTASTEGRSNVLDDIPFSHSNSSREELEERFRRSIVKKVQRDLGREIQFILDERDRLISQLRKENTELRKKLEKMDMETVRSEAEAASSNSGAVLNPALLSSIPFPEYQRQIAPTIKPSDAFVVKNSLTTLEDSEI